MGRRPSRHIRKARVGKGRRFIRHIPINRNIPKRRKVKRSYGSIRVKLQQEQIDEFINSLKKDDTIINDIGKFVVKKVPARPARKGINPFTQKEQMFKAKPASRKIKFYPSKNLKGELI